MRVVEQRVRALIFCAVRCGVHSLLLIPLVPASMFISHTRSKPVGMNIPVDPLRTTGSDEGIFIRTRLAPKAKRGRCWNALTVATRTSSLIMVSCDRQENAKLGRKLWSAKRDLPSVIRACPS